MDEMKTGWVCPKCGRVYAPTQVMCLFFGGGVEVSATGTGAPLRVDWSTVSEAILKETKHED